MNRGELVLAVLSAAGGRPYTPAQLQKALFLISRNAPAMITQGDPFNFRPYDYGPFDSSVYEEARRLRSVGEVEIAPSPWGQWNTYAATDLGLARGQQLLNAMPPAGRDYIDRVSAWVRSLDFATLVKSIYDAYPDMKANSIFKG